MQGAGNDFIVADNTSGCWKTEPEWIAALCDRHKGIGGDGLILLKNMGPDQSVDMCYYNSDGSYAAACGNGTRCAASYVYRHFSGHRKTMTLRSGGKLLPAEIQNEPGTRVRIQLPVTEPFKSFQLESGETVYKGGVGVPHVIVIRNDLEHTDIVREGRFLRNHPLFQPEGANVDFLELHGKTETVLIRTYERGVEDETLACGTGCASAGTVLRQFFDFPDKVSFLCRGKDEITVEILKECCNLSVIDLIGPAETVFDGMIDTGNNFINHTT